MAYITEQVRETIVNDANIIVFPESSLPVCFIREIKRVMKKEYSLGRVKKPLFIVAGSQVKEIYRHNYELCTILLLDPHKRGSIETYDDNYRNFRSPHDSGDLSYGNNGVWRYVNTGYGNFVVLNCFDFLGGERAIIESLRKKRNRCDIIIVVAHNPAMDLYDNVASTEVRNGNQIVAIANMGGLSFGESRFYGPYRDREIKNRLKAEKIPPEEESIVYHEMNAIELDKSRGIRRGLLSETEETELTTKYYTGLASQARFGPIHLDKWATVPEIYADAPISL